MEYLKAYIYKLVLDEDEVKISLQLRILFMYVYVLELVLYVVRIMNSSLIDMLVTKIK